MPFQKAGGNNYESVVSQLAFTAAEAPVGPAIAAAYGLTIGAEDLAGNPVQGVWITIHSSNGTLAGSGYSPLSFAGEADESYKVTVADYDGKVFQHWKDNDSTDRSRTIHQSSASPEENVTTITAVYDTGDSLRGITPLNYTGTEEQPDLTVRALTAVGN